MAKIFIALTHYPVYNKKGDTIATSITNMDIHDISRTAKTFGVEKYFLVHPSDKQHEMVSEILDFWHEGYGGEYNKDRKNALDSTLLVKDFEEIREKIGDFKTIVTGAVKREDSINYDDIKKIMADSDENFLILFGTGWGLVEDLMNEADYRLDPIYGAGEYNHLSVRSAVAIILDRLTN